MYLNTVTCILLHLFQAMILEVIPLNVLSQFCCIYLAADGMCQCLT